MRWGMEENVAGFMFRDGYPSLCVATPTLEIFALIRTPILHKVLYCASVRTP